MFIQCIHFISAQKVNFWRFSSLCLFCFVDKWLPCAYSWRWKDHYLIFLFQLHSDASLYCALYKHIGSYLEGISCDTEGRREKDNICLKNFHSFKVVVGPFLFKLSFLSNITGATTTPLLDRRTVFFMAKMASDVIQIGITFYQIGIGVFSGFADKSAFRTIFQPWKWPPCHWIAVQRTNFLLLTREEQRR